MTKTELFKLIVDTSNELEQAKYDLANMSFPRITHSDIEDVSDRYQAALEYQWWAREQSELIDYLEGRLAEYKAQLDNYEHKGYEFVIKSL